VGRSARSDATNGLRAAYILLVEDSFLILMELESALTDAGAQGVCSCRTVGEAMHALDEQDVSAAILDIQLDRETSAPVARELAQRGVPFFFYTGQLDTRAVHDEWPDRMIVSKPAERRTIVDLVSDMLAQ